MFYGARSFNQDMEIGMLAKATSMQQMFYASSFNQDLGNWDVSNVTNMMRVFNGALVFNQDIVEYLFSYKYGMVVY